MEYSSSGYSNTPEDSGLGESSRNESTSNSLYTPTTSLITSRKRKIFDLQLLKSNGSKQIPNVDSIESSPWIKNPEILSSTLNDSITTAVENCKIDNYACNYYLEQLSNNNSEKECTDSFLKEIKEPSTPEKSSNKRYCTTKTSPRVSPMLKLGSPERNEILYSNLPNLSRLSDNKRCSPAKKRLFSVSRRRDPVKLFCVEMRCGHIIANIFALLDDKDLYNCSKVSRRWKMEIAKNHTLDVRLKEFEIHRVMNKENNFYSPMINVFAAEQSKQSTPIDSVWKLPEFQITKSLTENQHVEKCFCCNQPVAVVERNISQCTSPKCGAICCLKCNSISTTGPEKFVDKCQQSILLIEKPSPRFSLLSSPKRIQNLDGTPTFFHDDSLNISQTYNSSGYLTDNELSQSRLSRSRLSQSQLSQSRRNSLFSVKDKERGDPSRVLKTCNVIVSNKPEREWMPRHNILPVIPSMKRKEEIIEPSSPPKVKDVAGSKKSKRRLKRLNL